MTGASVIQPPQSFVIIKIFDGLLYIQTLLQVAVYVPAPTWIGFCVLPLCVHVTVPAQPVAVNVAFCVPQIFVTSAVIVGAFGAVPL